MRRVLSGVVAGLVLFCGISAEAQSLADVARKEADRRKTVAKPGKIYTNDSLKDDPSPTVPSARAADSAPTGTDAPAAGATPPGATSSSGPASSGAVPQTEAEWRKRVATARDSLSRLQTFSDALQTRVNALSADFVNRDDPAQREAVAADRRKALAELDRVKQEITQQQKELATIQEEARRANVPAGWVR